MCVCLCSHQELGLPKRPLWDYSLSKASLEQREKEYFDRYLKKMYSQPEEKLSFIEHNLEVSTYTQYVEIFCVARFLHADMIG